MAERPEYALETLREDREFAVYRGRQHGYPFPVLTVALAADQPVYVIANNKAEGSAPLTLSRLAAAIAAAPRA